MPQTQLAASSRFSRFRRLLLASVAVAALAVIGVTALATPTPSTEAQSRIDYDQDNDQYIEVSDFRQFDVIRYDLDTDGVPTAANASDWREWFPRAEDGMGCPNECIGYELVSDIYIAPRWSENINFVPIGSDSDPFMGRINGNGNLIVNLRIMRPDTNQVGLFGSTGSGSIIEGLAITDPVVKGGEDVGVIVGKSLGTVRNSFAVGRRNAVRFVEGTANVGGLVGTMGSGAELSTSYARIHVVAATEDTTGNNAGGLIGSNAGGSCMNSYYSGDVDAHGTAQGLIVGAHASGTYSNCIGDSASDTATGNVNVRLYLAERGTVVSAYVDADSPTTAAAGSGTATGTSVETYRDMASQSHSDMYAYGYEYLGEPWSDEWNVDVDGDQVLDEPWHFGSTNDSRWRGSNCETPLDPNNIWICRNTGDLPVLQYGGHNPQLQFDLAVPRTAVHYPQNPLILGDALDAYPPQATVNLCERTLAVANEILRVLKFETVDPAVRAYEDCTLNPTDERNVTIADLQQVGNNNASTINLRGKGLTSLKPGDFDYLTGYPLRIDLGSVHDGTNVPQDLTDNNLTTLPPRLFEGVKIAHLDLSGNNITHLPWDLFGTAPLWPGDCVIESGRDSRSQPGCHVSSVLLHDNQLTENGLPPAIFDPLTYLNALTLHNNQLDKINTRWFQMLPWLGDNSLVNGVRPPIRSDAPFKGLYLHGNEIRYRHYDGGSGLSQPVVQTWALSSLSGAPTTVGAAGDAVKAAIEARIDSATQTGNAPKLDLDSTAYWQPRYQIDRIDPDITNADTNERVDARAGTTVTIRDENGDPTSYTLPADIWVGRYRTACGQLSSSYTWERNYKTSDCWIIPHSTAPNFQIEEMTDVCNGTRSPLVRRVILNDSLTVDVNDPDAYTTLIEEFVCPSAASNGVVAASRLYGITELDLSFGTYGSVTGLMPGDFDGLKNLQVLRLDANELTTEGIPPTVFRNLPNLVGLYLNENRILHVNTAWFETLSSLGGGEFVGDGDYDIAGLQGGLFLNDQEDEDGNAREVRTFYFSYMRGGPAEGEGTQEEYYDKEQLRTEIVRVITRAAGGTAPSTLDLSPDRYSAGLLLRTKYSGPEPYFATAAPPPLTVTAPGGRQSLQVNFLHRPRVADNPIVRLNPDEIIDYEYRYRVTPADPSDAWSNTIGWRRAFLTGLSSAGSKTITIPNLVASSNYQIQVRPLTNGGGGTSSDQTATTAAGETSVDITVSHTPAPGTGTDPAGVHNVAGYEFRYRVRPANPDEPWTAMWRRATLTGLDREGEQSIAIYGLEPSTIYQVQVRALSAEERGRSSPIVTITSGTLINLPEINRIEPTITEVTVQTGADIRLEVDVYGLANRLDNSIPESGDSNLVFSWTESPATGGTFSDPNDGRRVTYTAPDLPGSYRIVAEASPNGICRPHHESAFGITDEQRAMCVATFNVRVTRAPTYATSTAAPVNPVGLIPSSLTDSAGVAYAVFTPVEGGTFTGEGISVSAAPGAVPDEELIGVSATVTTLPIPESGPTSRLTVGGSFYVVNGVQRTGDAPVTGYRFDDPVTVCLPMPNEFRGNISDIVLVDRRADGTLGMLGSRARVAAGVVSACGNVSQLPVTLAVARLGAPERVAPEPTPEIVPPDTGGSAPSATGATATLVLGILTLAGTVALMAVAGIRRRRFGQPT